MGLTDAMSHDSLSVCQWSKILYVLILVWYLPRTFFEEYIIIFRGLQMMGPTLFFQLKKNPALYPNKFSLFPNFLWRDRILIFLSYYYGSTSFTKAAISSTEMPVLPPPHSHYSVMLEKRISPSKQD